MIIVEVKQDCSSWADHHPWEPVRWGSIETLEKKPSQWQMMNERKAWHIMGNPPADWTYGSIASACPKNRFIKKESFRSTELTLVDGSTVFTLTEVKFWCWRNPVHLFLLVVFWFNRCSHNWDLIKLYIKGAILCRGKIFSMVFWSYPFLLSEYYHWVTSCSSAGRAGWLLIGRLLVQIPTPG